MKSFLFRYFDEMAKRKHRPQIANDILHMIPDIHMFYFSSDHGLSTGLDRALLEAIHEKSSFVDDISLPFPVCAFSYVENEKLFTEVSDQKVLGGAPIDVYSMIIKETSPGEIVAYNLGYHPLDNNLFGVSLFENNNTAQSKLLKIVTAFLFLLRKSQLGCEKVNKTFKIRGKNLTREVKIKEVVHVRPGKATKRGDNGVFRQIDWTHRFEVMGHWRQVKGIGKDRKGQYCLSNMTWVVPHERGPEDKPLIKKTRVVTRQELYGENVLRTTSSTGHDSGADRSIRKEVHPEGDSGSVDDCAPEGT